MSSKKILATGLLAGVCLMAGAADDNPLHAERWRTRPLVVVAPDPDHPLLTGLQAQLRQADTRSAFDERDMVLFTVIGDRGEREGRPLTLEQTRGLKAALGVTATSPATVFLVGKDGSVKRTDRGDRIALAAVFAAIDGMPMRQR